MNHLPTYAETTPGDLTFDIRVQRLEGLNDAHVRRIARNFNPAALGVATVSAREDGTQVVLDGRHRVAAAMEVGHPSIPAIFYHGLTLQQEAELFLLLNDFTSPSAIAKFKVRVVQGDPDAVEITRILEKNGWTVAPGSFSGYFNAVVAAERIYHGLKPLPKDKYPDQLNRVLKIIVATWGKDFHGVHRTILTGLASVLARYGDEVDNDRMVNALASTRPSFLIGDARSLKSLQGGSSAAALSRVIVGKYNSRLRSGRLPDWTWTTS